MWGKALGATSKAKKKYSYETGSAAGAAASTAHASPSRISKVLRSMDKHPPPLVPQEAQEAAHEAVKRALHSLDEDMPEYRVQGLMALAEWINNAFGPPAEALGYELRKESIDESAPALVRMIKVLNENEPALHRVMLMVLSNLVSDAFDKASSDTKRLLETANIFPRLVEFIYNDNDMVAQVYACACMQNLCQDLAFARLLRAYDVVEELERLVDESPNDHVKRYASGALFNCVEAIHKEVESRKLDEQAKSQAKSKKKEGRFQPQDEEKHTTVEIFERLVDGHKVTWVANKPTEEFEGKLRIVEVEVHKDTGMACAGDRVKVEGGCEIDLTIVAGKNLCIRDKKIIGTGGSSDPYVVVHGGLQSGKRTKALGKTPVVKLALG